MMMVRSCPGVSTLSEANNNMPCDAISTISAKVSLRDELTNILNNDQVHAVLKAYLNQEYHITRDLCNSIIEFSAGPYLVSYDRGQVTVTSQSRSRSSCDQLAKAIIDLLTQGAGMVLKDQVQAAMSHMGYIESVQDTSAGRVITMDI